MIYAAHAWKSNAHLIADCAKLGYLHKDWLILDPTYGRGNWWTVFRPNHLVFHDMAIDGVDFRDLPHDDNEFQAVAFDPPYIAQGGRSTSGVQEFLIRYALHDVPKTANETQELINDGLTEMARVVASKGYVLVKVKDYITSGKLWIATYYTQHHGFAKGLELVDKFQYIKANPQARLNQVHARRNYSTLLVFRKP